MNCHSRFNAGYRKLGAGALGWPRGMVWEGKWEGGSGGGTHVHLWRMHVDVWENQYNIVKLKKNNKNTQDQSPLEWTGWISLPSKGLSRVFSNTRQMQIKTTMRYLLTALRMAAIQKSTNNKCWRGCGEKETFLHCWWEWKLVQPLWRTVWRFLKKLEIELPYYSAIPLLGIHSEETRLERDMCAPMFIAALFITARTWKQPRCPSADEWIRKL